MAQGNSYVSSMILRLEDSQLREGIASSMEQVRGNMEKAESRIDSLNDELSKAAGRQVNLNIDLSDVDAASERIQEAMRYWRNLGADSPLSDSAQDAIIILNRMQAEVNEVAQAQQSLSAEAQRFGQVSQVAARQNKRSMRSANGAAQSLIQGFADIQYSVMGGVNNLEMFMTQLQYAQKEGESMGSTLKTIMGRFLSPTMGITAAVIGVAALYQNWDKVEGAIQSAQMKLGLLKESQIEYNEAAEKGAKAAEERFVENLSADAQIDVLEKLNEGREAAREELGALQEQMNNVRQQTQAQAMGVSLSEERAANAEKTVNRIKELRSYLSRTAGVQVKLSKLRSEQTKDMERSEFLAKQLPEHAEATRKEVEETGEAAKDAARSMAELKAELLPDDSRERRRIEAQLRYEKRRKQIKELTELSKAERQELNKLAMEALASDMRPEESDAEERTDYTAELQETLIRLEEEGVQERVSLIQHEYEQKIAELDRSAVGYTEYREALEREATEKQAQAYQEAAKEIGKQARQMQEQMAEDRQTQLENNLDQIESALEKKVAAIEEKFDFRSRLAEAAAGGTPGSPVEGYLRALGGGVPQIRQEFAARRDALQREFDREQQIIQERLSAEREKRSQYDKDESAYQEHTNNINNLKSRQVRAHEQFEKRKTQVSREYQQRRREMQVTGIQRTLGNFSSASQSMFNSWRSDRERELDKLGKTEEEKNAIIKKEGKARFKTMKTLMIAQAIGDTLTSGIAAFRYGMQAGGPVLAGTMLAGALATGFAQVQRIRRMKLGDSAGGGSGGGSKVSGSFTQLNGSIASNRRAKQQSGIETRPMPGGMKNKSRSNEFSEAAGRMEKAAERIEKADRRPRISRRDAGAIVEEGNRSNDTLNA